MGVNGHRCLGLLLVFSCGCGNGSGVGDEGGGGGGGSESSDVADLPPPPREFVAMAAELRHVCDVAYAGDETRVAFDPTVNGPHGLLFIAKDGSAHPLNNVIPPEWRPTSASAVELVACVGDVERVAAEGCDYIGTGASIARWRRAVRVDVVSPRTAASTFSLSYGSDPSPCPGSTTSFDDIVGGAPSPEQLQSDVVDRYVPVPVCGSSRPFASCLQCWRDAQEATANGCGTAFESSDRLPRIRTGEPATIDWEWQVSPNPHFLSAVGFDWSGSADAELLANVEGPSISFIPDAARAYSFLARARLPGTPDGVVVAARSYTLDALDRPVIQSVLGASEATRVRLGVPSTFRFTVAGRPDSGHFQEEVRWTWVERPPGSAAATPAVGDQGGTSWAFTADVAGTYRLQLEYSDGVGFSAPATSEPITTIDGPLVDGLSDKAGAVGTPLRLEGFVTYAVGVPRFAWAITSVPAGSAITPTWLSDTDSSNVTFVPDVAGAYAFEVVVTDDGGSTEPIPFTVTAN